MASIFLKNSRLCDRQVEDFESRPHKAVTFRVERDKEFQVWREQKMPNAPPGFSGGELLGRSEVEEGREEEEGEEEDLENEMDNEVMREILARVLEEADAVGNGVTRNAVSPAQSTNTGQTLLVNPGSELGGKIGWVEPKTILEKEMLSTCTGMTT